MNAEIEFEKWLASKPACETPFAAFEAALALGRKSGIDAVDSLPHRAMFDAGVEFGRKSGMEEAAEIAMQKDCPHDLGCGQSVAAAIRQRIEEMPCKLTQ